MTTSFSATPPTATSASTSAATTLAHPQAAQLATLVYDCLFEAVASGRLSIADNVMRKAQTANLSRQDAEFDRVNLFDALVLPVRSPDASCLVADLFAFAIAQRDTRTMVETTARALVWLATYANVDAFVSLDAQSLPHASAVWNEIADMIWAHGTNGSSLTRAEAIVAAMCMAVSDNPLAIERKQQVASLIAVPILIQALHARTKPSQLQPIQSQLQEIDPVSRDTGAAETANAAETVVASTTSLANAPVLEPLPAQHQVALQGELAPVPRGPIATTLLAVCGWLFVSHVVRSFARVALQCKRPAEVRLTAQGVMISTETTLLGRKIRSKEQLIRWAGLLRAAREIRFARLGLYAGLLALGVGSFVGLRWLVDGVRSGSWWLVFVGIAVVIAGVVLDFVLTSWLPSRNSRCRIVLVARNGKTTCVSTTDSSAANALLRGISTIGGG